MQCIEEAFSYAQEALELCIEERICNKQKLPEPTIEFNNNKDKQVLLSCEYDVNAIAA